MIGCVLFATVFASAKDPLDKSGQFSDAIRDVESIDIEAAVRAIKDMAETWPDKYTAVERLKDLEEFGQKHDSLLQALKDSKPEALAEAARLVNAIRSALLANPLVDFKEILLIRRGVSGPNGLPNNWEGNSSLQKKGYDNEIMTMTVKNPGAKLVSIYKPGNTEFVGDLCLHFNADRLLFSSIGSNNCFQVFEIGMDGKNLRQVTPGAEKDVDNYDACYLPGGDILFGSTATYLGVPCVFGSSHIANLYRLDSKSGAIRQVTFEQEHDWNPVVMPNGRILYQRWEYTDAAHANSRMLFHMNPDGTDQRVYSRSGSFFPGSFFYARPLPGNSRHVIGVATGHHGVPRAGRLLILDPAMGQRDGDGIVQEIPGHGKKVDPIVRDGLIGSWPQFLMPFPLSDKYFLVTAKMRPDGLWGIYLADIFDNLTLIKEVEGSALFQSIPLKQSVEPRLIPSRVNLSIDTATAHIADIHAGPGLAGVARGTVKRLRIYEYYFSHRGLGGLYGTLGFDGPWDIKRIIGTVPVERDGSAYFTIPANTPIAIQPLDEKGQALQLMRTWLTAMPGENVSCVGCHESPIEAPITRPSSASRKKPSAIEPWHGPTRGFSFTREVQPVLTKYCIGCHGSKDMKTIDGNPIPNLKGDEMLTDWQSQQPGHWGGGGKFTKTYFELQRFVRRPGIESDRRMIPPMDFHFSTTELGQILRKGHHGVHLDAESWERLAAWADLNAPYYGTWGEIPPYDKQNHVSNVVFRARELRRKYVPMGPFPDYEQIPETPKYDTTPVPPSEASIVKSQVPNVTGWPFDAASAGSKQKESMPAGAITNLSLPDGSVYSNLVWIPAGAFVMGGSGHPDEHPTAAVKIKKGFWMSSVEIPNAIYLQFDSKHESRTEDRHGYQFGITGYDQEQPDHPVVRVSWEEAMAFCKWLSQKTGRKVNLPTEAQWEWSCRAGASSPFWYGDLNTDFSQFANLGDAMLAKFVGSPYAQDWKSAAVSNPNKYDNWIPQDARFNDGGFVTEPVSQYKPNSWGLHNMHGNAGEWTRSIYKPYPYDDDDGRNRVKGAPDNTERVVRGGSWYDRPFRCTSSFRLPYRQYQRVHNVGFRIVLEE